MSYPVKLADLQARTLQAANLEGATAFITPTELINYINASIAEWVDEVRGTTWNGTYSRSSYTFSTSTSSTAAYALPADFLALLSVDVVITTGSRAIAATAYQEEQRNAFSSPGLFGWGSSGPIFYQLQGGNIAFIPVPQGQYRVTLNYVPTAPILTDPDDFIDSINGWEEFVVLDAAIKCLIKAGDLETIPALESRLARQRERIRAMVGRRDQQTAERVHAVVNQGLDEWDW